jgi:hypothetical protein
MLIKLHITICWTGSTTSSLVNLGRHAEEKRECEWVYDGKSEERFCLNGDEQLDSAIIVHLFGRVLWYVSGLRLKLVFDSKRSVLSFFRTMRWLLHTFCRWEGMPTKFDNLQGAGGCTYCYCVLQSQKWNFCVSKTSWSEMQAVHFRNKEQVARGLICRP